MSKNLMSLPSIGDNKASPVYRTLRHVGSSSTNLQRFFTQLLYLVKNVEEKLQLNMLFIFLLTFVATLVVSPWLLSFFAVVQLVRVVIRFYLHHRFPGWEFSNISSLRCALDTVRLPGMITMYITLDGDMELEELQMAVRNFLNVHTEVSPILKQRICSRYGFYMWKEDEEFDVMNHVVGTRGFRRHKSVSNAALQNHVSDLCSRPLDNKRPPWEMILLPLPRTGNTVNCAILFRMHHLIAEQLPMKTVILPTCMNLWGQGERMPLLGSQSASKQVFVNIFEGISSKCQTLKAKCNPNVEAEDDMLLVWWVCRIAVAVLQRVFVESQKLYENVELQSVGKGALGRMIALLYLFPSMLKRLELRTGSVGVTRFLLYILLMPFFGLYFFCQLVKGFLSQVMLLGSSLYHQMYKESSGKELMVTAGQEVLSAFAAAFIAPGVALHELTKKVEPVPILQCRAWSGHRIYAWTPPVSTQLIRKICEATNSTPSDVLLSSCAGILRHYFRMLGREVPENVCATIPLCPDCNADISQTQGFSILPLPTGEAHPLVRLNTVQQRMQEIRSNPYRYVLSVYLMRYAVHFLPQPLLTMMLNFFSHKYPVTITDISISDAVPATIVGNSIQSVNYWRPAQGNIGMSLTLLHYSQGVSLAFASDREALPQPTMLTSELQKELNDMAMKLGLRFEREISRSPYASQHHSV